MTGTGQQEFRLNGTLFWCDLHHVQSLMIGVQPQPVAKHWVEVNGVKYPPKQVVAQVTGMPLASFTTQEARRALDKIGLHQRRVQVDWNQVLRLVAYENGWEPQQEMPHLVSFDRGDGEIVSYNPDQVSDDDGLLLLDRLQRSPINLLAWHGQPFIQEHDEHESETSACM